MLAVVKDDCSDYCLIHYDQAKNSISTIYNFGYSSSDDDEYGDSNIDNDDL